MIRTEKIDKKGNSLSIYIYIWNGYCSVNQQFLFTFSDHFAFKYHRELKFNLKHNIDKDFDLYVKIDSDGQDNTLDNFILQ